MPRGGWGKLASLTLTSRWLAPGLPAERIDALLVTAAAAVGRLPALNLLELWNGGKGLACVFRYRAPSASAGAVPGASITWRATWNYGLEGRVVGGWEKVAYARRPDPLRVVVEGLDAASIQSHGDAIQQLSFSHNVAQPVSLEQIQKENRY